MDKTKYVIGAMANASAALSQNINRIREHHADTGVLQVLTGPTQVIVDKLERTTEAFLDATETYGNRKPAYLNFRDQIADCLDEAAASLAVLNTSYEKLAVAVPVGVVMLNVEHMVAARTVADMLRFDTAFEASIKAEIDAHP